MANKKVEGFWWSEREPHFPKPIASEIPFSNKDEIVNKLKYVEENIQNYTLGKRHTGQKVHYKGYSECRCCGKEVGSAEFRIENWTWPEGLLHYVLEHNIKPSEEFIASVLKIKQ